MTSQYPDHVAETSTNSHVLPGRPVQRDAGFDTAVGAAAVNAGATLGYWPIPRLAGQPYFVIVPLIPEWP
jgi:hypothetical protein